MEEKTPYLLVVLQECEKMNMLTSEIKRTPKELDLGRKEILLVIITRGMYNSAFVRMRFDMYHVLAGSMDFSAIQFPCKWKSKYGHFTQF